MEINISFEIVFFRNLYIISKHSNIPSSRIFFKWKSSQLVLGYHWLTFVNQVSRNFLISNLKDIFLNTFSNIAHLFGFWLLLEEGGGGEVWFCMLFSYIGSRKSIQVVSFINITAIFWGKNSNKSLELSCPSKRRA